MKKVFILTKMGYGGRGSRIPGVFVDVFDSRGAAVTGRMTDARNTNASESDYDIEERVVRK